MALGGTQESIGFCEPMEQYRRIQVIDSHTGGEPTRVVIGGAPEFPGRTPGEIRDLLKADHDWIRSTCILEPRGHEAIVGAFLCEPTRDDCVAGVVFFNNVGYLNGCVHGTIGLAVTLAHMGRIGEGVHRIESPTGILSIEVTGHGQVTVRNVRSYRFKASVPVEVPGFGQVRGDIAWGGNWFFLIEAGSLVDVSFQNIELLKDFTCAVSASLKEAGVTGEDGGEIDHIEVFGPPVNPSGADSKNFVLCPGRAYDRSPCGTGTSAKLACLHADGKLKPGETWRQAGILDTIFEGSVEEAPGGGIIPTVKGSAFITAESELLVDDRDPFRFGIGDR